jgi:LysM repeat protein
MKKISLWVIILVFTASLAQAQESATQQEMDKLSGQIQDLLAATDYVTHDELKKIADQISEVDKKRQDDSDMIATQISNLAKTAAGAPLPPTHHATSTTKSPDSPNTDATSTPQNGYYYEIKQGDTLGLIVKAYRDQGVKVTKTQVLKANPGLDPNKLYVGKKIFIPDPSAKPAATKE